MSQELVKHINNINNIVFQNPVVRDRPYVNEISKILAKNARKRNKMKANLHERLHKQPIEAKIMTQEKLENISKTKRTRSISNDKFYRRGI